MRSSRSWMAEVLTRDPALRQLQRRFERRLKQLEIRHLVCSLRRAGTPGAVEVAAERLGVSRWTVTRALRATGRAASR